MGAIPQKWGCFGTNLTWDRRGPICGVLPRSEAEIPYSSCQVLPVISDWSRGSLFNAWLGRPHHSIFLDSAWGCCAHGKAATTIEATDQNGGKIEIVIRV